MKKTEGVRNGSLVSGVGKPSWQTDNNVRLVAPRTHNAKHMYFTIKTRLIVTSRKPSNSLRIQNVHLTKKMIPMI